MIESLPAPLVVVPWVIGAGVLAGAAYAVLTLIYRAARAARARVILWRHGPLDYDAVIAAGRRGEWPTPRTLSDRVLLWRVGRALLDVKSIRSRKVARVTYALGWTTRRWTGSSPSDTDGEYVVEITDAGRKALAATRTWREET